MARHPQMQCFQSYIQKKRILGRLNGTHIPHQLCGSLGDICQLSKLLCIDDPMIGLVRCGQPRKLVAVRFPVKISAVYDGAAHAGRMAVHILCGRVDHDVRSPLNGPAVDRCRKGIVHDKRNPVGVGRPGKLFQIQDNQRWIGNGLTEYGLGVLTECPFQLPGSTVRIYKSSFYAHLFQRMRIKVICTAVKRGGTDDMVPCSGYIHHRIKAGSLTGGCQHGRRSPFQVTDLCRYSIICRVLEPGIKITGLLQIEQTSHLLTARVPKCGTLVNWQNPRFPIARLVSGLDAFRLYSEVAHVHFLLLSLF